MILAQVKTWNRMKCLHMYIYIHLVSIDFQPCQDHITIKQHCLQKFVLGQLHNQMQTNEAEPTFHDTHKSRKNQTEDLNLRFKLQIPRKYKNKSSHLVFEKTYEKHKEHTIS